MPPLRSLRTFSQALILLAAAGCSDDLAYLSLRCDVIVTDVSPATAEPGETLVLTGGPFTTDFDTAAYVGGERATVLAVDRVDCETCDDCRSANECNACGDCDACDAACDESCIETASIELPAVESGAQPVTLFNSHGESAPINVTVLGADPVDPGQDTGASSNDTAGADTGADTSTGDSGGDTDDTGS